MEACNGQDEHRPGERRLLHPRSLSRVMGSPVSPRRFCSWIGRLERSHGAVLAVHARTRERAAATARLARVRPRLRNESSQSPLDNFDHNRIRLIQAFLRAA